MQFGRRYPKEQFCEISLNLDQSSRGGGGGGGLSFKAKAD